MTSAQIISSCLVMTALWPEIREVLGAMDQRIQSRTCWTGFMFVNENLALRELQQTKVVQ